MAGQPISPLHRSRRRTVDVPGHGQFEVPRHIVRIDIDSPKSTHGWQVRYDTPSRYFGDGALADPERSLAQAKRYLRQIYRGEPKRTSRGVSRRRGATAGVRIFRNAKGHWYAEATHPGFGAPKRFYVGTDATCTGAREERAMRRARAMRKAWLAALPVPRR